MSNLSDEQRTDTPTFTPQILAKVSKFLKINKQHSRDFQQVGNLTEVYRGSHRDKFICKESKTKFKPLELTFYTKDVMHKWECWNVSSRGEPMTCWSIRIYWLNAAYSYYDIHLCNATVIITISLAIIRKFCLATGEIIISLKVYRGWNYFSQDE